MITRPIGFVFAAHPRALAVWLLCCAAIAGLLGCGMISTARKAIAPAATVTAGTTSVQQKGDAQTPATAATQTQRHNVTLPAGSIIWQDAKTGAVQYQLSRDTSLAVETRTEQVNAPQSFAPPKPPTAKETAEAQADYWTVLGYRIGVAVGLAAAIYGLAHAWPLVMWGGIATGGACLFGLFVRSHPLLLAIIGIGVALKVAGPAIWHWKLKPTEPKA